MRGHRFVSAAAVAVCADDMLVGLVTIERLLAAAPGTAVVDVMDREPPAVAPGTDQERAAWAAVGHDEPSLAVVDTAGRFLGLVPPPDCSPSSSKSTTRTWRASAGSSGRLPRRERPARNG